MLVKYFFILLQLVFSLADFSGVNNVEDTLNTLANYHKSPCSYHALADYIDQCSEKSFELVDSRLRLQLAVRLSLCEFEEAGVEYPDACKHITSDDEFSRCVKLFRASSQLWTTYSGNYRKLRSVCYEESLPYTKYHIIELYTNITNAYSMFYDAMKDSFDAASAKQDEVMAKLLQLLVLVDEAIENKTAQFEGFHHATSQQMQIMLGLYLDLHGQFSLLAKHILDKTTSLGEDFQGVLEVVTTGRKELANAQKFEYSAILHDLHSLALFLHDSMNHAGLLVDSLHHTLEQGRIVKSIILENEQKLQMFFVNHLDSLIGYHDVAIDIVSDINNELGEIEHQTGAIGRLAGITKNLLDEHFHDISEVTRNITQRFQVVSGYISEFPLSMSWMFQSIGEWSIKLFTAIISLAVFMTLVSTSMRNLQVSKFFMGLIPGLFLGLLLRLWWLMYFLSLLHI